jgi:hypothetical protein
VNATAIQGASLVACTQCANHQKLRLCIPDRLHLVTHVAVLGPIEPAKTRFV